MEEQNYRYDAFISYRHLPLDKAVAVRLQELLESFRPPKGVGKYDRIKRIFRDQSELPTSGNLGADIHEALLSSRYLIVICTEKTRESTWCMEEIRQFKESRQGRTDHILVVTASGEPTEVFPEALLSERMPVELEDGSTVWQERIVEPLCCDVRAESIPKSLKRLKSEFLRVAAPLIGCRYDDLYQRHRRRRRHRMLALTGGAFALLSCILVVVSVFAYRTWQSEKSYRQMLAETYVRQGTGWMEDGKMQEALLCHASALALEPETQKAARLGAAILLEQNAWPYLIRTQPGAICNGILSTSLPDAQLLALDRSGEQGLIRLSNGYGLWKNGELTDTFPKEMGTFLEASAGGDYWVFLNDELIFFYRTEDGDLSFVPRPSEVQSACRTDSLPENALPAALPVAEGQAIVVYGGYVYLYDRETHAEKARVDLAPLFRQKGREDYLYTEGRLWVSEDGSLAVVASGFGIASFHTADLSLKSSCLRLYYYLNDVAIRPDGSAFACIYGNSFGDSFTSPGGYLEVFDRYGDPVLETPVDPETPYEGGIYDGTLLLAWSRDSLHFWDTESGRQCAVPLKKEGNLKRKAVFGKDSYCVLYDGDGTLYAYNLLSLSAPWSEPKAAGEDSVPPTEAPSVEAEGFAQALTLPDGQIAAHNYTRIFLLEENPTGAEPLPLDEVRLDYPVNRMMSPAGTQTVYLFAHWESCLYRAEIAEKAFSSVIRLDTRGQVIDRLYPIRDGIAAVTGTGQILFYRSGDVSPLRSLQLEHSGVVLSLQELDGGCLSVRVRFAESAADGSYQTAAITELWDAATGIHIADLAQDLSSEAALSDIPSPDKDTLAFFLGLTCCTFDEAQNLIPRNPELLPLGNWERLLTTRSVSRHAPSPPEDEDSGENLSLEQLIAPYESLAEDTDPAVWLAGTDTVWQTLRKGAVVYSIGELDTWFRRYWHNASDLGCLDQIEEGVSVYLLLAGENELQGNRDQGMFDGYVLELLGETTAYDKLIAAGFLDLADRLELLEKEEGITAEIAYAARQYEASFLRMYGRLLLGGGPELFEEVEEKRKNGLLTVEGADLRIIEQLWEGNAEEAAAAARENIRQSLDLESDLSIEEFYWSYSLKGQYALVRREILKEEVFDRYLQAFPAYLGLEVSEVSPQALEAGLQVGDLILAINGRYFGCMQQAQEVYASSDLPRRLDILRENQMISLNLDDGKKFGAAFRIRFDK